MEKSIKVTRTEQNMLKSFAGESQARSRYTFFASVAKKEGFIATTDSYKLIKKIKNIFTFFVTLQHF